MSTNAAGQNDGTLESTGETAMFWVDLSAAHFIEGSFSTATSTNIPGANVTPSTTPNIDAYMPQAKLGKGNSVYVYSYHGTNYFGLSGVSLLGGWGMGASASGAGSLTPQEAFNFDKKVDDGMPLTGRITAIFVNCCGTAGDGYLSDSTTLEYAGWGWPATVAQSAGSWSCFDNGGVAGVQPTYSLAYKAGTGINCGISVQFQ